MNPELSDRSRLASEAYDAIRSYLLAYSPGDDMTMIRVDSEAGVVMEALEEATYRIEKA